jgi:hypothetical protein
MQNTNQANGLREEDSQDVGLISIHSQPRAASLRSLPWANSSQAFGLNTKTSETDSVAEDV